MEDSDFMLKVTETRVLISMLTKYFCQTLESRLNSANAGIGQLQHGILRRLQAGESTSSELSREFMLSPSTMVPAVDALERKQLVIRSTDPNDRRRIPLRITEKGLDLIGRVPYIDADGPLARGLREMELDDVNSLIRYLKTLLKNLPDGEQTVQDIEKSLENYTIKENRNENQ